MAAIGMIIVALAALVAFGAGLANSGSDHTFSTFSILGLNMTASSGRIFIYGAITGVAGMLGLNLAMASVRHRMKKGQTTRRRFRDTKKENETLAAHQATTPVDDVDLREGDSTRTHASHTH